MAQGNIVMAFRKRLKSYGYTDIRITKKKGYLDKYKISAIEPLAKIYVITELSLIEMYNSFR